MLLYPLAACSLQVLYAMSCMMRNHAAAEEYFVLHFAEAIIPKAISAEITADSHPSVMALMSRAMFLCNALIMSDYTSEARVEKLRHLLLPTCLKGLKSDSIDLKETTENLVASLQKHNVAVHHTEMLMLK